MSNAKTKMLRAPQLRRVDSQKATMKNPRAEI
jgi:hypothetical protein